MIRAEAAGYEWLLALDADELVCLDRNRAQPAALARALRELPEAIAVVSLPNLEVVQRSRADRLVFRESRLFKLPHGPRRVIADPRNGRPACRAWFLGHAAGKSIVRLGRGALPRGVHGFCEPGGGSLQTATLGELLHYYAYDFEDWLRRGRLLSGMAPEHALGMAVEPQKLLWIELAERLDEAALRSYFDEQLTVSARELDRCRPRGWRRLFRRTSVVEVESVARAFEEEAALRDH
jgi:hypothetical protein